MFFEGCHAHLGCSIKLRGASEYELARVKEIIMMMVCVAYHSQLEISFLMDEFAMPPSLAQSTSFPCLLEGASAEEEADGEKREKETNGESQDKPAALGTEDAASGGQPDDEGLPSDSSSKSGEIDGTQTELSPKSTVQPEEAGHTETMTSSPFSSPPAPPLSVSPPFLLEEDEEMTSDTLVGTSQGDSLNMEDGEGSETPTPKFRDPLQDDTGLFVAEQVDSTDDRLKSISAVLKQELKDIILCISPFITFREPFLLTPAGMHCPSRDYFPEQVAWFFQPHRRSFLDFCFYFQHLYLFPVLQVYLSPLLNKDFKELDGRRKRQLLKDSAPSSLASGQTNGSVPQKLIDVLPCHSLTSTRIVEQLTNSQDLAKMLAEYRAKGGRIRQREAAADPFSSASAPAPVSGQSRTVDAPVKLPVKADSEEEKPSKQNDMSWAPKVSDGTFISGLILFINV